MPPGEFDVIAAYFARGWPARSDVVLGVGDDAAILDAGGEDTKPGQMVTASALAIATRWTDTVAPSVPGATSLTVSPEYGPEYLARATLTRAVMRLAVRGARPRWLTLGLTLPAADTGWLARFSTTLRDTCAQWRIALVGGDTTRGPLAVSAFVQGVARPNSVAANRRNADEPAAVVRTQRFDIDRVLELVRGGHPAAAAATTDPQAASTLALAHGHEIVGEMPSQGPEAADAPLDERIYLLLPTTHLADLAPDAFRFHAHATPRATA